MVILISVAKQDVSRQHAIPNSNGFCRRWVLVSTVPHSKVLLPDTTRGCQAYREDQGAAAELLVEPWPGNFTPLPSANSRPSKNRGPGKKCPETSQARTQENIQGRPGLFKA